MSSELAQPAARESSLTRSSTPVWTIVVVVVAVVIVCYAPTFASMVKIWNRDSTFTHGYIIPLLCAWLLWRDRAALSTLPIQPAPRVLLLVALLALVWLIAQFADIHAGTQAGATALISCALWAALGNRWARRAMFPLAYLMFAVPFGDFLVPWLVKFTTQFTVIAVRLVGVPIFQQGNSFSLPSGNFEVIKACSGVRYLIATLALGTLFAALSYRTWRRRILFMTICLGLPVVANGLRAFGIVMIANFSQMRYAVGIDHLIYGWLFFGLVMWLLFWIGSTFADTPVTPSLENISVAISPMPWPTRTIVLLVSLLAVAPLFAFVWSATSLEAAAGNDVARLQSLGEWRVTQAAADGWQPQLATASGATRARYTNADEVVNVFLRSTTKNNWGVRDGLGLPLLDESQQDWKITSDNVLNVSDARTVEAVTIINASGMQSRIWRWYFIDGEYARSPRETKLRQLRAWLQHRRPSAVELDVAVTMNSVMPLSLAEADADQILTKFVTAGGWQPWQLSSTKN